MTRPPSKLVSLVVLATTMAVVLTLLSLPAFFAGRASGNWYVWDYLAIYLPAMLWVALCALGVGHQSLSHIVELLALIISTPALVSARVFFSGQLPLASSTAAATIFALGVATAVLLRVAMPHLQE